MNELQPIDLDDVASYFESRNLVRKDQISYYVRWLQRFLTGPGADPRLSPQDAQRVFVEQLERSGDVQDWLVRQAIRAVDLYQKHYLRHRLEQSGGAATGMPSSMPTMPPKTLDAAINEARRLIRLRHYAYRTEQTYLNWMSQYAEFVKRRELAWDEPDSVRAFGEHGCESAGCAGFGGDPALKLRESDYFASDSRPPVRLQAVFQISGGRASSRAGF